MTNFVVLIAINFKGWLKYILPLLVAALYQLTKLYLLGSVDILMIYETVNLGQEMIAISLNVHKSPQGGGWAEGTLALGATPYKYPLRAQPNSTCKIIPGRPGRHLTHNLKFAEGSVRIVLLVPVY